MREAQRLVTTTRRKLADLPGTTEQLSMYGAIIAFTASGISDAEIAVALQIPQQQVAAIKQSGPYRAMESSVIEAAKAVAEAEVQRVLAEKEHKAAQRLTELVDSVDEKIALTAARDVLDRRGHTAAQRVDIRQQMENTFRIVVEDRRATPVIDME
jgi:DNA-binding transcriptional MerR regulator